MWISAILVIGTMAYPFLQILPSKNQQLQIAFRQEAKKMGLHIHMRPPVLAPELQNEYSHLNGSIAYSKSCLSTLNQSYIAVRSNTANEWFWLNHQRPPAVLMNKCLLSYANLPAFCLAVEQNALGSTIFMYDALETSYLPLLEQALNQLNNDLINKPA